MRSEYILESLKFSIDNLNFTWILLALGVLCIGLTYLITKFRAKRGIKEFKSIKEAISASDKKLQELNDLIQENRNSLESLNEETSELQALKENADLLAIQVQDRKTSLESLNAELLDLTGNRDKIDSQLKELMAKLDLYSRIDEYTAVGHFEIPDYLYETSPRFAEEIKLIREKQRDLIKQGAAITYPDDLAIHSVKSENTRILKGQVKLMLGAFNIECNTLIGKVKPSTYARTLERIEKLANIIEKSASSLRCGFNLDYVKLKYEECRLQFQFSLKKQEEQEEQRLIREQIREEQRAIREYQKAIKKAEAEERMYREMLQKARDELLEANEEERLNAEQKIAELEARLAEAEATEARAKSMAEQTRKGHVYIISNIGSFGENIYKIGLTRRLDPLDRVKELGDASVPFPFDVHAIIYAEDAPALETSLHREFSNRRVNAVNFRKEFFYVDLEEIRKAVEKISDDKAEFRMTALAEDYYETCRLRGLKRGFREEWSGGPSVQKGSQKGPFPDS